MLQIVDPWGSQPMARAIDSLRQQGDLGFLWAPGGSPANIYRDQASGLIGKPVSPGAFGYGGVQNPVANNSGGLQFATNAGVSGAGSYFVALILVSIVDPTAVTGAFLKIGGDGTGLGFGGGNTHFEELGAKQIVLRENIAWHPSAGAVGFVAGLNIITIAFTTDINPVMTNWCSGDETGGMFTSWNAASAQININGYSSARGSNASVHLVAIYNKALSNAQLVAFRPKLYEPFMPFSGRRTRAEDMRRLFSPSGIYIPSAAASGLPTLSDPTFVPGSLAANGWRPRFTATY